MTVSHIFNTLCFILPCFSLLLLTFKDHLRTPVFIHISIAILLYLVITFYGSSTYVSYISFPLKYLTIGLFIIILCPHPRRIRHLRIKNALNTHQGAGNNCNDHAHAENPPCSLTVISSMGSFRLFYALFIYLL